MVARHTSTRSLFAGIAALLVVTSVTAQWEPIDARYTNVRGTNYVPVYESLHSPSNQPAGYAGVACPTAMWRFWTEPGSSQSVDAQLDMIKGAGFNAIRVWISYPLWWADRLAPQNRMLDGFADLLTKCEQRNLYVMPVFWDDHCYGQTPCSDPDYLDPTGINPPYNNISHWTPNPGQAKIDEFAATNFTSPEFVDYVTEIAQIGGTSPALLMWDAMNEPSVDATDSFNQRALIEATLALLKKIEPSSVTTIGFIGIIEGDPVAELAGNPDLDVISIHPYGTFRENVHLYCRYAAEVLDGNGMKMDKPLLLTECGQPGRGQGYQDVLQYVKEVTYGPSSDPARHQGCGFFVFSAMCGWENGNFPHRDKHGIFFHDGEVREIDAVLAFEQFAIEHGIDPRTLTRQYVQKRPGTPGWFAQLPLELGHDYEHTRLILFLPQWYYSALSLEQGHEFADLFDIVGYDAAVVSVGPHPASTVTALDLQLFALMSQIYRNGDLFGTPLTLQQRNALLDAWRFELLRHVGPLTGAD